MRSTLFDIPTCSLGISNWAIFATYIADHGPRLTLNPYHLRTNSPILSPYYSYKSTGGEGIKISRQFSLGDHILNSHDHSS